jgi:hypothetical protein
MAAPTYETGDFPLNFGGEPILELGAAQLPTALFSLPIHML